MKKLIFIFLITLCFLCIPLNVKAAETEETYSSNCFYSGSFQYTRDFMNGSSHDIETKSYQYSSNEPLYIVKTVDSDGWGFFYNVTCGKLHIDVNGKNVYSNADSECLFAEHTIRNDELLYDKATNLSFPAMSCNLPGVSGICNNLSQYSFAYTLPVFDFSDENFEENINKYLFDGDMSGASNYEELYEPSLSNDVEPPLNLKVIGGFAQSNAISYLFFDKDTILTWNQEADTSHYKADTEIRVKVELLKQKPLGVGDPSHTGKYFTSSWVDLGEMIYAGENDVRYTITKARLNDRVIGQMHDDYISEYGKPIDYKCYSISAYEIRIRNIEYQSLTSHQGEKCSNYVVYSTDYLNQTNTAVMQDKDGNVIENDLYNGQDVVDWENSVDYQLGDLSSVLDFIHSGFGMTGSNGLITMLSDFFSCMPKEFWVLILTGIGLVVLLCVIGLIKKIAVG